MKNVITTTQGYVFSLVCAFTGLATAAENTTVEILAQRLANADDTIKVLALSATNGFRHGPAIDASKLLMIALEETTEFDFTITEDLTDLNYENLAEYDVLFFNNSTLRAARPDGGVVVNPGAHRNADHSGFVTPEQRAAISRFAANGGGIAGAHSALDAFFGWQEYRTLMGGGLFKNHPWTQEVRVSMDEADHPITSHLDGSLTIRDEIYVLDHNPRPNSRVLATLDMASVPVNSASGEEVRQDFPISWVRDHFGAKVFVTKLGHFPEVWQNAEFVQQWLAGMRFAAGRLEDI